MMGYKVYLYLWLCLGLAVLGGCAAPEKQAPPAADKPAPADAYQHRIAAVLDPANPAGDLYDFRSPDRLIGFYRNRDFQPAWGGSVGNLQQLHQLLTVVGESVREGLNPEDYHLRSLTALVRRLHNTPSALSLQARVRLECWATDAFLTYARHALFGRINSETSFPALQTVRKEADLNHFLEIALDSGSVDTVLRSLLPNHAGYTDLRRELARYRAIAASSEWPLIPAGGPLNVGVQDVRVTVLRKRLQLEEYAVQAPTESAEGYDFALKRTVADFQRRHGLAMDGIVGAATRDALNISVEKRIAQIELNLERWRRLPRFLGHRYLFVNIADFELKIIEDQSQMASMRAIVGRNYRQTPIFSASMNTIVFNPYWYVPHTIFIEDLLPKIKADADYLKARNYRIFSRLGPAAAEVDPAEIDWNRVAGDDFNYILRKEPGPANPLGRVKFVLPNPFNVYIHDTPAPAKFLENRRDFSSGCIRIENPIALSEYLLKDDPRWSRENILAAVARGTPTLIRLLDPIPVHIVYMTAWTDRRGRVQFRPDIYDRDAVLIRTLFPSTAAGVNRTNH